MLPRYGDVMLALRADIELYFRERHASDAPARDSDEKEARAEKRPR